MPRLYLHMRHGRDLVRDPDGADFENLAAARAEAILAAREIMSDRILNGREPDATEFEITDEDGKVVMVFPFHDAIDH